MQKIFRSFRNAKIILLFVGFTSYCSAQTSATIGATDDLSTKKEISIKKISDNLFLIRSNAGRGNPSTIVSIGKDGVFMVDANMLVNSTAIKSELGRLGNDEVNYVVNTHVHADHTEANSFWGEKAGIIGTEKLLHRISHDGMWSDTDKVMAKVGWPTILVEKKKIYKINGEKIEVIALPPGHMDGDLIVFFKKNHVLVTGDYFFLNKFPVFDFEHGADFRGYFKNIKFMLSHFPKDTKVIPGHGSFTPNPIEIPTISQYKQWYLNLLESIKLIKTKIDQGMTLDQIQTAGLPEKFSSYDVKPRYVPIKRWIETVWKSKEYLDDVLKN